MRLYVTGDLKPVEAEAWQRALAEQLPEDEVCLQLTPSQRETVEVAVVANPAPGLLDGLPALRLVQSLWAGVDRLLATPGALPPGVPLARMVDPVMSAAMVETGLWAVLSLHRGFFQYARQQALRQWQVLPQRRADERRVLVLGLGELGRGLAQRLIGQGYRVSAWRSAPGGSPPGLARLWCGMPQLPLAMAEADILINLLPLTPATERILQARTLSHLPAGASLVNLARGRHLVIDDLMALLDQGHLSHAVLDVFEHEPLPPDDPLWAHPKVTVLPHAAAQTDGRSAVQVVVANVQRLRRGEPLQHLVDLGRGY